MNWRINIFIFILTLMSCKKGVSPAMAIAEDNYLIEVEDLKSLMNQPNIKILDFRKKEAYNKGHITGAMQIWRNHIVNDSFAYGGMMASTTQIETLFRKLGIHTNDTIIVYDDEGLCEASRLWWILQNYNFKQIKLLHGGIEAWKANGGQVTKAVVEAKETEFKLNSNSSMAYYVSKDEVLNALDTKTIIIDTRTIDEFSGANKKNGAAKAGRIPNSIHIDWTESINYHGDKRLKPVQDLEKIFKRLNINKNDSIILYCHSGVRSAHTTFVLTQVLDYKNVKNYDGSWTEWSHFEDLPFEIN